MGPRGPLLQSRIEGSPKTQEKWLLATIQRPGGDTEMLTDPPRGPATQVSDPEEPSDADPGSRAPGTSFLRGGAE